MFPAVNNVLILIAMLAMSLWPASAQTATGTISIIVEDSSQAVVPNAAVTVTKKATSLTRTGATGPRGEFLATFLPAGEYAISSQAGGFKRVNVASFILQVDQNSSVSRQ